MSISDVWRAVIQNPFGKLSLRYGASSSTLAELQKGLQNGSIETTGDVFRDFVIAAHGKIDTKLEAYYRGIDRQLAGKKGELVVFCHYLMVPTGKHVPLGHDEEHRFAERFSCGFLTGDHLVFHLKSAFPDCSLPTGCYVEDWMSEPQTTDASFHKGNLVLPLPTGTPWHFKLLVGQAARAWLTKSRPKLVDIESALRNHLREVPQV